MWAQALAAHGVVGWVGYSLRMNQVMEFAAIKKYVGTSPSRLHRTHAAHMVWWFGLGWVQPEDESSYGVCSN